jgi:hypothetical protein
MYDIDITEPLQKNVGGKIRVDPISLGDDCHYSPQVDMLMTGNIIQQALRSLQKEGQFNLFTLLMLIVGVAIGIVMGIAMPFHISSTTTTTTTTSSTTTIKTTLDILRMWLMK